MKTTIEAFRDFYVALGGSLNDVKNIVTIPAMIEVLNQVTQLGNLTNVALNSPSDGQVLTYDGTSEKWKNADAAGGGSSGEALYITYDGTYNVTVSDIQNAMANNAPIYMIDKYWNGSDALPVPAIKFSAPYLYVANIVDGMSPNIEVGMKEYEIPYGTE